MTDEIQRDEDRAAAEAPPSTAHALYDVADVAAALGGPGGPDVPDDESIYEDTGGLGASRRRLQAMLAQGEPGRWRRLAHGTTGAVAAVEALEARAPHMADLTSIVARRLRASMATRTPFVLPPLVLVGPPGVGKTWLLGHLARIVAVPFRLYPFNLATLGDGLSGSHPGWRASAPGLIARTLLREEVANPLIVVDELDKAPHAQHVGDPYRALYAALEPACSSAFVDEHLGVPIDASAVQWVASANDVSGLPGPILDRLTVVAVPEMEPAQRAVVVHSIYADANARYRGFFDPEPSPAVVARLAATNPRKARLAVDDAMVRAAADGRRTLSPEDVPTAARPRARGAVH